MTPAAKTARIEALYALALRLYPPPFRDEFTPAMRQALRDAIADPNLSRRELLPTVLRDLAASLVKEHLAMLRDTFTRPALVFNALVLAGISTVLALALYAIPQQVLRLGADDPQIQLAGDLAARLEQGAPPAEAVPASQVDMARSLSPFVIVYDDHGRPLASQAQLNGKTPAPPQGVFDFVRQHGQERVSWQPILGNVRGVRVAAVVQKVEPTAGSQAAFVLAGRSLQQVEERESQVRQMAALAWIAMLALIVVGTAGFGWFTRRQPA
jgi:hypothetical protein